MTVPLRILLLEDDPVDAELTERALRKAGLSCESLRVWERDAFDAALEDFAPDIVLADYHLPRFDGVQALARVRERDALLPFIFVTGALGEEAAVALLRAGADDYVLKDRVQRLPTAIERALDVRRQQERLRATEQALRESEARFRDLVEMTADWIWEVDAEGRYDYVSPVSIQLLGYRPEELLGRTPIDLMRADEAERVGRLLATFFAEQRPFSMLENVCLHKDGHEVVVETSGTPIFAPDGRFLGYRGSDRDVTERKALALALEESRERLSLALDASDLGTWDWQIPAGRIQVNERWGGMLGYGLDELEPMTLATWEGLCHPDDLPLAWRALQRHFAGDMPIYEAETRLRHKAGHWVWVLDRGKVVERAPDGQPLRMAGTHLDVSDRRVSDEALRKLSLAVEQSPASIVITDLEARIEYVNPAFSQVSGYSREEALGQNPRILNSGATPAGVYADLWATLQRGEVWRGEFYNRRKDGEEYIELAIISPVRQPDGPVTHYLAVKEDITEKKRVEQELEHYRLHLEELVETRTAELKRAEEHSRLILESSADGLFGEDLEGCATFINPAACAMLGYRPDEVLGHGMHALIHHSHADGSPFPREDCPIHGALTDHRVFRQEEDVFWRADGRSFPVTYSSHPMYRDGEVVGSVVSFFDITAHKQAEAAREAARSEAERLARLKSEFLANMSHEIRTPLNAVLGFAQVGERQSDGRKAQRIFRRILTSGQLLLGIVNDILDFSKIEAGKLVMSQEDVDLRDLMERCVDLLRSRAQDKGLGLRIEAAEDLPASFRGDDLRLAQVLGNLLSNAIKFTERGEVVLKAAREGDWLLLSVVDTGIGMSAEQVANLFHPFEQADGSITRRFGGTGLGLAISQRLTELMGGEIRVQSRLGAGSRFDLRIPLTEPLGCIEPQHATPRPVTAARQRQRLRGLVILVAEDNPANRLVLEELLSDEGCWLAQVENGLEALERVRKEGPTAFDLVLMDIQMPVMDGLEATRRIRELAPGLPVIGLTAHALRSERDQCLAAGMVDHVAKPVDLDLLVTAILDQVASQADGRSPRTTCPAFARTLVNAYESAAPGEAAQDTWVDWPALEARYAHNPEFLSRLMSVILESNQDQSARLRAALDPVDHVALAFAAHRLKGSAGNLFARRLHRLAVEAEEAARNHAQEAPEAARALADALDGLLLEIRMSPWHAVAQAASAQMPMRPDRASLAGVVERLKTLLAADDTAANDLYAQEEELLRRVYGDAVRRLGREIQTFDYTAALETLGRLEASSSGS